MTEEQRERIRKLYADPRSYQLETEKPGFMQSAMSQIDSRYSSDKLTPEQWNIYHEAWIKEAGPQAATIGPGVEYPAPLMERVEAGAKHIVSEPSIRTGIIGGVAGGPLGALLGGVIGESEEIIRESLSEHKVLEPGQLGYREPRDVATPFGEIARPDFTGMTDKEMMEAHKKYAYKRIGYAGSAEYIADLTGKMVTDIMAGGFKFASKDPLKRLQAKEAMELRRYWGDKGGLLILADVTDNYTTDTLTALAAGSFTGGRRARAVFRQNVLTEAGGLDDIRQFFKDAGMGGMNPHQAGSLVVDMLAGGRQSARAIEKELYGILDELNQKGVTVRLDVLDQLHTLDTKKYATLNQKLAGPLKGYMDGVAKTVRDGVNEVPFSYAHFLRSRLITIKEMTQIVEDADATRLVSRWISAIDNSMTEAANSLDATAYRAWRKANSFSKANHDTFFGDIATDIMRVVNKDPKAFEMVSKKVFQEAISTGNPASIKNLRSLFRRSGRVQQVDPTRRVAGPVQQVPWERQWREAQYQFVEELLDKYSIVPTPAAEVAVQRYARQAEIPEKGLLRSADMLKWINSRYGKGVFDEMWKHAPLARGDFVKFLKAASAYKQRPPGSGMMVIQLAQGGALAALPALKAKVRDVAMIFIAPWAMARALFSPRFTHWVVEGLKTPAHTGRGLVIGSRMAYYAAQQGVPIFTPNESIDLAPFMAGAEEGALMQGLPAVPTEED